MVKSRGRASLNRSLSEGKTACFAGGNTRHCSQVVNGFTTTSRIHQRTTLSLARKFCPVHCCLDLTSRIAMSSRYTSNPHSAFSAASFTILRTLVNSISSKRSISNQHINLGSRGAARQAGAAGLPRGEAIPGEGALVFAKACELRLEGIVSRRLGGLYWSGRWRNWVKVRIRLSRGDRSNEQRPVVT